MKTILPRIAFVEALSAAANLTGSRTTKPILACVKLVAAGKTLEVHSTDGEAGLRIVVRGVAIEQPGQAVIPAERLLRIVREMMDAEIRLEAQERQCTIRGAGSEFRIFVMNASDFPPVASFDDEPDLSVPGHELRRMIGLTIYAAARETSRYAINGVLWKKQAKKLFLVATDGRRLARAGGALREARSADFDAIVPARALAVFEKVFVPPKDDEDWLIAVKVLPNQVLLKARDAVFSTVLVEGNFPAFDAVIPKGNDNRARLNRTELAGAIRRAEILTTEESRAVRMAFDQSQLVITANAPEQGDARVEIPAEYSGKPLEVGFNPVFLLDALRVITFEQVNLELEDAFRPGILCGEDKNEFLYVVMPVSLAS
ncbi:MAG: DNA polymerase III subunit beta [Phycisphaerae bacterium]